MVTKTAAIKAFLTAKTHPDLASAYTPAMECQVNVASDGGERVEGEYEGVKWNGYSDGRDVWKPFRVPRNASTIPEYTDSEMNYDLAAHAEGIGMTGWDWKNCVSKWCAYDFDSIIGHSDAHSQKLTPEEMNEVKEVACKIPWVTVRYSTSGRGLHLYVYVDDVPTQNHSEHAGLARSILAKLSSLTGFDFSSKVDICGGNMWVWHRKMVGTDGLKLIKQGGILKDIPPNWREHIKVVRGVTKRLTSPTEINGLRAVDEQFESLSGQRHRIRLDEEHLRLITYLNEKGHFHWWDADHNMLVTHTMFLKEAHIALQLRGVFETETKGTTSHNCFAYPIRRGGWSIRRYTPGVKEHPSWDQDGAGWTRTFLNVEPNLQSASKSYGGIEDPSGGFMFAKSEDAQSASNLLGANVSLAPKFYHRAASLKTHKDGARLVFEFQAESSDNPGELPGWLQKGKKWVRIFGAQKSTNTVPENDGDSYDDIVRHIVNQSGDDMGWTIQSDKKWRNEPLVHVRSALQAMSLKKPDIDSIVGNSVIRPWTIESRPFAPEYPGNRVWNRNAPQFLFVPSKSDNLVYPTWTGLLKHIGQSLDPYVAEHEWCKANGVQDGGAYLKLWIASMLQFPYEPLPYLFVYGEMQETGKSSFYEALQLLFNPGVQNVGDTLKNKGGFNGELLGAILCYVEEASLAGNKMAYERLKEWVTSKTFNLHFKGSTPCMVPSTMHFVHCANPRSACPIFPGDTRITMVHVQKKPPNPIPKRQFHEMLRKEGADFLGSVTTLEIPSSDSRLRIPVIQTDDKHAAEETQRSALMEFIDEQCFAAPGEVILVSEFYDKFKESLEMNQRHLWSKRKVSGEMPDWVVKGRMTNDANWHFGNISFTKPTSQKPKLFLYGEYLRELKS